MGPVGSGQFFLFSQVLNFPMQKCFEQDMQFKYLTTECAADGYQYDNQPSNYHILLNLAGVRLNRLNMRD